MKMPPWIYTDKNEMLIVHDKDGLIKALLEGGLGYTADCVLRRLRQFRVYKVRRRSKNELVIVIPEKEGLGNNQWIPARIAGPYVKIFDDPS